VRVYVRACARALARNWWHAVRVWNVGYI